MPEDAIGPCAVEAQLDDWRRRIDRVLGDALQAHPSGDGTLGEAMRHAVLLGGKRMRPLLTYATGTAFGVDPARLDAPAAAVELIHAYSLVHDDLPAMDDDALRRGQPTVHVVHGEAGAILAGDALQALAFELLAETGDAGDRNDARRRLAMVRTLAQAAGAQGMCGGQARDLAATGADAPALPLQAVEQLHGLKTGALLRAAVRLGALAADVGAEDCARLDRFASALGLAFQIRDDLLDVEGDAATLGKTPGKDAAQAKATVPALIGIAASHQRLVELGSTMQDALAPFGERAGALAALGRQAAHRDR
ncbi:MAG TPA: farnesyl diphosphate synthase [Luteimonas sp.]|nr:farnesyl diphosphate synthase [Luteimonas sp.]